METTKQHDCRCNITGGKKHEREIAEKVIRWCLENGVVSPIVGSDINIKLKICKYATYDCWGTCIESGDKSWYWSFNITIANDQSIRDFVATIVHEIVHVNQYVTGEWEGDGEKECEEKQYAITDEIWNSGTF